MNSACEVVVLSQFSEHANALASCSRPQRCFSTNSTISSVVCSSDLSPSTNAFEEAMCSFFARRRPRGLQSTQDSSLAFQGVRKLRFLCARLRSQEFLMHGRRHIVICMLNLIRKSMQNLVSIGFVHVVQCPQLGPVIQHSSKLRRKSTRFSVECSKVNCCCAKTPLTQRCVPLRIVCTCPQLRRRFQHFERLLLPAVSRHCCFQICLPSQLHFFFYGARGSLAQLVKACTERPPQLPSVAHRFAVFQDEMLHEEIFLAVLCLLTARWTQSERRHIYVGRLERSVYGTQDESNLWQKDHPRFWNPGQSTQQCWCQVCAGRYRSR